MKGRARLWVARFRFDGKDECYLGTVVAEGEMEAEGQARELWASVFPFDPPRTFAMEPGHILLVLDKDAA